MMEAGRKLRGAARVATAVLAGRLGWDNARARTEIANYESEVERVFGIAEKKSEPSPDG